MNYEALDEALEYIEEGFFTRKIKDVKIAYAAYDEPQKINTKKDITRPKTSVEDAIIDALGSHCKCMTIKNKNGEIEIAKSNESGLNDKIYVYKLESVGLESSKKYKISSVEFEGTLKAGTSKYKIGIKIIGKSNLGTDSRKKAYAKAKAIAHTVLSESEASKKYPGVFKIAKVEAEDIEGFEDCEEYDITLIDYNIRDIKKKCDDYRELTHSSEFKKVFNFIDNELNKRIKKEIPGAGAEYLGDWDDGPFVLTLK